MRDKSIISGYELPVKGREEDVLDRWRFATEVWGVLGKAPQNWSVRVGIYGAGGKERPVC